jgi:hypothetical protein
MPPDILAENLRILEKRHPRVHRQVLAFRGAACAGGLHVLNAASGLPTLEVHRGEHRVLLHSRSDPAREARRLAEAALSGSEDLVAVGGLGLGYLAEAALGRCGRAQVVVLEPDPGVLVKALESRDLAAVLEDHRTVLVLDQGYGESGSVAWSWETIAGGSPPLQARFVATRGYRLLYGGLLQRWESSLLDYQRRNRINTATLDRFDRLWTRNTFRNAHLFFTLHGVRALRGAASGVPAVVLGAGPSLERCVDLLREAQQEAVLIASDTVLLPLLRRGIVPDFTVTVDPQYVNSLSLCAAYPLLEEPARDRRAPLLVADPAVHPASLHRYPGTRVLTSSVFAPGRLIERFSGSLGRIAAGGSVMTTAFDLARILGASPVYLMGLDLSYRGLKTHLSGSFLQEWVLASSGRLRSMSTALASSVRSSRPVRARDCRGEPVTTDSRLLLYRSWFQGQDAVGVLNATPGGLEVEHIPRVEPERILVHRNTGKTGVMAEARGRCRRPQMRREGARRFVGYLASLRSNLRAVADTARRGEALLASLSPGAPPPGDLARVDLALLGFPEENRLISMVMQRSIHRVLQEDGGRDDMQAGLRLYRDIARAAVTLTGLLDTAARRVEGLIS